SNLGYSLRGEVRLFFGGRLNLLRGLMNPFVGLLIALFAIAVLWLLYALPAKLAMLTKRRREHRLQPEQQAAQLSPQEKDVQLSPQQKDVQLAPQQKDVQLAPQQRVAQLSPQQEQVRLTPRQKTVLLLALVWTVV